MLPPRCARGGLRGVVDAGRVSDGHVMEEGRLPTEILAKNLVKLVGLIAGPMATHVEIECLKGEKTVTLTGVMPDRNERGRPTIRTICVIEDGRRKTYDGKYPFQVTAIVNEGRRVSMD